VNGLTQVEKISNLYRMSKFWYMLVMAGLLACNRRPETNLGYSNELRHARAFHFENVSGETLLIVDEPWPGAREKKTIRLTKPLTRVVCTSTSHLPYFEMLGMEDAVVGFPNVRYITSEKFLERAASGQLVDIGVDGNLNIERLIQLKPDAVIAFDMGGESATLKKIEQAGIPVYNNSDFLEKTPLGRAEWIKFFGALLNKRKKADSIFNEIEAEYFRLQKLTENLVNRPTVLSGVVYGDSWFLPGGQNWSAIFIEDAGGNYLWRSDPSNNWLELSLEAVFQKAKNADYWIGAASFESREEMAAKEGRYARFLAFQNKRVFTYDKRMGPGGGFDIFESGYARPDLVLADLISILHPELLPDYETTYFRQLP
jgi:iron complex transport system substrate-binding protein